jgi:hypothetical protein
MQTVIETAAYLADAKAAGLSVEEMTEIVDIIAAEPECGVLMQGTGGCRKLRVAGRGKGKSGGYRLITFFGGAGAPVFLLTVFGKDEKDNLSPAERNALAKLTKVLISSLGLRAVQRRK